ncbi:MAG: YciI family protein [Bacteroidota bacterium]|nr:YciI family protein [Bacteroidota bacterium]
MQQYLIIARDGNDTEAFERRMKARTSHFEVARQLKLHGQFVMGGAILDDHGKMTGSVMVVQFEREDDLLDWMRAEPYINEDVWQSIEVKPFRIAEV